MEDKFKTKIDQIRELLGVKLSETATVAPVITEAQTEAKFMEATATDGTIVKWEGEMTEGTKVMVVTPTGDQPAPDGSIEFTDGTIITTAGGVITAITKAVAKAPEVEIEMAAKFSALQTEIETLKTELAKVKDEAAADVAKIREAFTATVEIVEEMNKKPSEPTPAPVNAMFAKKDQSDKIAQLAETFKSIVKK